jgi:hypothetical protein
VSGIYSINVVQQPFSNARPLRRLIICSKRVLRLQSKRSLCMFQMCASQAPAQVDPGPIDWLRISENCKQSQARARANVDRSCPPRSRNDGQTGAGVSLTLIVKTSTYISRIFAAFRRRRQKGFGTLEEARCLPIRRTRAPGSQIHWTRV